MGKLDAWLNRGQEAASVGSADIGGSPVARKPLPAPRRNNHILANLSPSAMSVIEPHLQAVQLLPGIPFHHQDLPLDCVYFAEAGVLSLLAITPAGETIEVASAGRTGAIWPILEPGSPHGYLTAVAPGPVQASRIDVTLLRAILSENGPLNRAFEACREALVLQLRQNAMCSGLHAVEHRLARWVLETADRLGSDLVPVTQETVAQRLGVRRTTVTLVASKLQEAMRWGRCCIEILNRQRLEASACACYATLRERTNGLTSPDPRGSDHGDES